MTMKINAKNMRVSNLLQLLLLKTQGAAIKDIITTGEELHLQAKDKPANKPANGTYEIRLLNLNHRRRNSMRNASEKTSRIPLDETDINKVSIDKINRRIKDQNLP